MPKMAQGSAFPRYCTNFGMGRLDEKTAKGKKRVNIVAAAHSAMVMIC
jgi:hypothetical protein